MIKIKGLFGDNPNIKTIIKDPEFGFNVMEFQQDLSVTSPADAIAKYYSAKMNCKQRFVVCNMTGKRDWTLSAGAMNWMGSKVNVRTDVKGVGDLLGKAFKAKATNESAIKPVYTGVGVLATEPTYKFIIPIYSKDWGNTIIVNDGLYLMSTGFETKIKSPDTVGGAVLGGEGFFNLKLVGDGVALLESLRPVEELIEVVVDNDVFKIDGDMALCWSDGLSLSVEKVTKTLVGSAASGEGLVNVYRGTGRILMSPLK